MALLGEVGLDGDARVTQKVLGASLGISRPQVSEAMRALMRAGLMERVSYEVYRPLPGRLVVRQGGRAAPLPVSSSHLDRLPGATRIAVEQRRATAAGWRRDAADYRAGGDGFPASPEMAARFEALAAKYEAEADRMVAAALERIARKRGKP